ncbi:MAG: hypothetical protein WKG01_11385 [Kofleriaceae bacterium]
MDDPEQSIDDVDALIELERRAMQIEILAVELCAAVQKGSLERAAQQFESLREEVEITACTLAVVQASASVLGLAVLPEDPARAVGRRYQPAPASCSTNDHRSPEQLSLESKERVLGERLIAVLVQLANLKQADDVRTSPRFASGLVDFEDISRFLHDQIGRLNAAWLREKRVDGPRALEQALDALRAIGRHRGLARFLDDAARIPSDRARAACASLAALLEIKLDERR